jgi:transcriptional regulator
VYIPKSFSEEDKEKLYSIIEQYSFAILFSQNDGIPYATHLPFMIDAGRGESGTLIAHFAKANKHWRMLDEKQQVLVVFQGPHSYITPHWYKHKETVPTWNYAAIHVYGKPKLIHEPKRLREMVTRLTHLHEDQTDGTWDRSNIESSMEINLKAIVGLEIPVERMEGKYKFNQNRSAEDQKGVMTAMFKSSDPVKQHCGHIMEQHLKELKKKDK